MSKATIEGYGYRHHADHGEDHDDVADEPKPRGRNQNDQERPVFSIDGAEPLFLIRRRYWVAGAFLILVLAGLAARSTGLF